MYVITCVDGEIEIPENLHFHKDQKWDCSKKAAEFILEHAFGREPVDADDLTDHFFDEIHHVVLHHDSIVLPFVGHRQLARCIARDGRIEDSVLDMFRTNRLLDTTAFAFEDDGAIADAIDRYEPTIFYIDDDLKEEDAQAVRDYIEDVGVDVVFIGEHSDFELPNDLQEMVEVYHKIVC